MTGSRLGTIGWHVDNLGHIRREKRATMRYLKLSQTLYPSCGGTFCPLPPLVIPAAACALATSVSWLSRNSSKSARKLLILR